MRVFVCSAIFASFAVSCGGPEKPVPAPVPESTASESEDPGQPAAAHGFVVFGQSATFASHMVSSKPPYDQQVIAEVKLLTDPSSFDQQLFAQPNPHGYHTFAADPFALATLGATGTRITGTLVAGNYQLEEHTRLGKATLEVQRLIVSRGLEPSPEGGSSYQGLVFGNAATSEYYLAHRVAPPPSFDEIHLIGEGAPASSQEWADGLDAKSTSTASAPLPRYAEIELEVAGTTVPIKTRAVYSAPVDEVPR